MITTRMLDELHEAQARDHTERRRDAFAQAALQGLIAAGRDLHDAPAEDPRGIGGRRAACAGRAWQMADAMLADEQARTWSRAAHTGQPEPRPDLAEPPLLVDVDTLRATLNAHQQFLRDMGERMRAVIEPAEARTTSPAPDDLLTPDELRALARLLGLDLAPDDVLSYGAEQEAMRTLRARVRDELHRLNARDA